MPGQAAPAAGSQAGADALGPGAQFGAQPSLVGFQQGQQGQQAGPVDSLPTPVPVVGPDFPGPQGYAAELPGIGHAAPSAASASSAAYAQDAAMVPIAPGPADTSSLNYGGTGLAPSYPGQPSVSGPLGGADNLRITPFDAPTRHASVPDFQKPLPDMPQPNLNIPTTVLENPSVVHNATLLRMTHDALVPSQAELKEYSLPVGFLIEPSACQTVYAAPGPDFTSAEGSLAPATSTPMSSTTPAWRASWNPGRPEAGVPARPQPLDSDQAAAAGAQALEAEIPVVNFTNEFGLSPIRCSECKAFINCYSKLSPGDQRLICNFCGAETGLDQRYLTQLDQRRRPDGGMDVGTNRPELTHEMYEIEAPRPYNARRGDQVPFEVFAIVIDVSPQALASGLSELACRAAIKLIQKAKADVSRLGKRTMFGVFAFNTNLHYVIIRDATHYDVYSVPEIDNSFVPAPRDLIVSARARGDALIRCLEVLPTVFADGAAAPPPVAANCDTKTSRDVCFGSAIQAAEKCMAAIGGRILYFLSALPTCGPGALFKESGRRSSLSERGGDQIKKLLTPCTAGGSFYTDLAVRASVNFISIDGFVCPSGSNNFCDTATLTDLSRLTAGRYHYFPEFNAARDGAQLMADAVEVYERQLAMEACVRVRASKGITTKYFFGNCYVRNEGLVQLAQCDDEAGLGVEISIAEPLKVPVAFIQISFLHTNRFGKRVIRVMTKGVPVLPSGQKGLRDFYGACNVEEQIALCAKKAVSCMRTNTEVFSPSHSVAMLKGDSSYETVTGSVSSNTSFSGLLAGIQGELVDWLDAYRRCMGVQSTGLDILPPKLQALPLMIFALTKNCAFRPLSSRAASLEERVFAMYRLEGGNILQTTKTLYPSIYLIHPEAVPGPAEAGAASAAAAPGAPTAPGSAGPSPAASQPARWRLMPSRLAAEYLSPDGIYVLEDVRGIYVYLNTMVPVPLIQAITGMPSPNIQSGMPLKPCRSLSREWQMPSAGGADGVEDAAEAFGPAELQGLVGATAGAAAEASAATALPTCSVEPDDSLLGCIWAAIDTIRAERRSILPVYVISAHSKFSSHILACFLENRVDGPSYAEFCKILQHGMGAKLAK